MVRYLSDVKPGVNPSVTPVPAVQQNLYANFSPANYWVLVNPSVPTGFVNLRWAPSKTAKIRATRYNGDTLRVIAENKTWAQVMDDTTGECGFMMKRFLEKVEVGG